MPLVSELLPGLAATVALMVALWLISIPLRDVSIIDLFWGVAVATGGSVYWLQADEPTMRATVVMLLVWLWAARLFIYLYFRNRGKPEDRRYAEMRSKRSSFWFQSLYVVFLLQAVLAWVIGLPQYGVLLSEQPLGLLDAVGIALFFYGLIWESLADWQLANFLRNRDNAGAVMDKGVWRYSRHPNYFGEFCLWWGIGLIALAAGAWWTLVGPLLLSFFLLKVSGVSLLEQDIGERRPGYREYVRRTSAFIPLPPRA